MATFIVLVSIGWIISFTFGIKIMVGGWKLKDKEQFTLGGKWFLFSIAGGWFMGWIVAVSGLYAKIVDKHFDDDKPKRVKG